jgi:hypothetical protein
MFWRVELDKEGSLKSCDACAERGKNGQRVIYVEAEDKPSACTAAKQWWEKRKNYNAELSRRRSKELASKGLCTSCGQRPLVNKWYCEQCRARSNERHSARRQGAAPPPQRPASTPEEARERWRESSRNHGGSRGYLLRRALKNFDALTPTEFRRWLVNEINRRSAPTHQVAHKPGPIHVDVCEWPVAAE